MFEASQQPKARLICHCTICQAFTGRPFSDVAIIPAVRVALGNWEQIAFRKYKRLRFPPPNLDRGRCRVCDHPVVETAGTAGLKLLFLPFANFARPELLPPPGGHMFYEHRQRDVADGIPKHQGYFASQWALARLIAQAL